MVRQDEQRYTVDFNKKAPESGISGAFDVLDLTDCSLFLDVSFEREFQAEILDFLTYLLADVGDVRLFC